MANKIQIKHGSGVPGGGKLSSFELGYATQTGQLYISTTGSNILGITPASHSHVWAEVTGKPSTFTPSSHTHSYLPLSGGTLTGTLRLDSASILLRGYAAGGWARGLSFQDEGATTRASVGAYGSGSSLSYAYFGESYSSTNSIRIYPGASTPRVGANDILHAGNWNSYAAATSHTHTAAAIGAAASTHSHSEYAKSQGRVVSNFNSYRESGMYGVNGTTTNGPGPGYIALFVANNADVGLQIAGGYTSNNLFFRGWSGTGATFYSWRTVLHSGNYTSYTSPPNLYGTSVPSSLLPGQIYVRY